MSTGLHQRTEMLGQGKTKIIWAGQNPYEVLIESKDDITAGDGAKHDILEGKAVAATTTTCNVFELINRAGMVPTHFLDKVDDRTFRARSCQMVPIEVVGRRIAYGSYLKRNPEAVEGRIFPQLVIEMFYKDDSAHDPYMVHDHATGRFSLYDAKQPVSQATLLEEISVDSLDHNHHAMMRIGVANVFRTLEKALQDQNVQLVDLKVEFGFDKETERLLLADVIDNDSWRIWPCGQSREMLDKQVYRDLATDDDSAKVQAMAKIRANYEKVAKITERFSSCDGCDHCGCH